MMMIPSGVTPPLSRPSPSSRSTTSTTSASASAGGASCTQRCTGSPSAPLLGARAAAVRRLCIDSQSASRTHAPSTEDGAHALAGHTRGGSTRRSVRSRERSSACRQGDAAKEFLPPLPDWSAAPSQAQARVAVARLCRPPPHTAHRPAASSTSRLRTRSPPPTPSRDPTAPPTDNTSQTPPRHLPDTSQTPPTPLRHLSDTSSQTPPPIHLPDTSHTPPTPPRHLSDTSQTPLRHLPSLRSRDASESAPPPSRNVLGTFSELSSRAGGSPVPPSPMPQLDPFPPPPSAPPSAPAPRSSPP